MLRWYRALSPSGDHVERLGVTTVHGEGEAHLSVEPIPAVYRAILTVPTPTGTLQYEAQLDLTSE